MSDLTWAEWRADRKARGKRPERSDPALRAKRLRWGKPIKPRKKPSATYAQKRRSKLDDAVLYLLASASEPLTEREIGAELGMDLTTVWVVTRRLQKRGELRCEQRLFPPFDPGLKCGQRFAWALAKPL